MDVVGLIRLNVKRWGRYAALRNAVKMGYPFVCAYVAVFDKLPQ